MTIPLAKAPIILFRLTHDGSQDGFIQPTPSVSEQGFTARDANAPPTIALLAAHLNCGSRTPTCWTSFATWSATISRLHTWTYQPSNTRPRNIRLFAVLMPQVKNVTSISKAFDLAQSVGLQAENYLKGEYLLTGLVNSEAFLINLPLNDKFILANLPTDYRNERERQSPGFRPGILCKLPANMGFGGPQKCYLAWCSELERIHGAVGAPYLDALVDALTANTSKAVADYERGGTLAPLSQEALDKLIKSGGEGID